MTFKVGDRILVISANSTGKIVDIEFDDVVVDMDEPEIFAVKQLKMSKEELRENTAPGRKPSVKLFTYLSDLRKLASSKEEEAEWKDIWDKSAN